jgi:hypothetical protein
MPFQAIKKDVKKEYFMTSIRLLLFAVLCTLSLASCSLITSSSDNRIRAKLGSEASDVINKADRVAVCLVHPNPHLGGNKFGPYSSLSRFRELTDAEAKKIASTLLDESTYEWELIKKNVFVPELGFLFEKGEQSCAVFVSLSSKKVEFHPEGADPFLIDTDPGHQRLFDAVKHLHKELSQS